jgi:hypothetical protein
VAEPAPAIATSAAVRGGDGAASPDVRKQLVDWSPADRLRYTTNLCNALLDGAWVGIGQLGGSAAGGQA